MNSSNENVIEILSETNMKINKKNNKMGDKKQKYTQTGHSSG